MPRPRKESNEKAAFQPHVRPVEPLKFGSDDPQAGNAQDRRQVDLWRALDEVVRSAVRLTKSTVGTARRVYYRANDPGHHVVPAGFVKHGLADHAFTVWKAWERGAPEIAFEVVGLAGGAALEPLIARYHELGVRELVLFDLDGAAGRRLRVWDRIDGDFVERIVEAEKTPCLTLDCDLAVGGILIGGIQYDACIRLARRDRHSYGEDDGIAFIPTIEEARDAADTVRHARELEHQATLVDAHSQREAALARGNARAAEMTSSNDRRLAEMKRPK